MSEVTTKGWIGPLFDNRVMFLHKELKNGGKSLTFDELAKMADTQFPGGMRTTEKLVQRVQRAIDLDIPIRNRSDAFDVKLPHGGGMQRWLDDRETKRKQLAKVYGRRMARGLIEAVPGQKPPVKVKRKYTKRMHPIEAITRSRETSLDNITTALSDIPQELRTTLEELKAAMQKHKFRKLDFNITETGTLIALEPVVQPVYTKL